MGLKHTTRVAARLVATICLLLSAGGQVKAAELGRGHKLLIKEGGLQIFAWAFAETNGGFNPGYFAQSNFTGVISGGFNAYRPELYGNPGEMKWGIVGFGGETTILPQALPYFSTLKNWCYLDEQDLSDPVMLQNTVNWMNTMRADPRVKDVILYTNQWGEQSTEAVLRTYMAAAQPDMLMFDYYVFGTQVPWLYSNGSPSGLYKSLEKYRWLSLAGNDGTGAQPVPFGHWLQSWVRTTPGPPNSQAMGFRMSESEIRLNQFAGWAFGAKFASAFTYDSASQLDVIVGPLLFDADGPKAQPTQQFQYMAETNRQSRNLGPSLLALLNTDARMVKGPNSWHENGVQDFDGTSDPFLNTVTATNLGKTNSGQRGDVVLGWFRPLVDDTSPEEDQTYFMVVNGLSWKDESAEATKQMIHLEFDFGDSGITSLQRLSRETGKVEHVPLVHDEGSLYHLDLVLPGGTGDLFKYSTGSRFVSIDAGLGLDVPIRNVTATVPEPSAAMLCLFFASGLALRPRR